MKEHPILFSGPMVRAILDGRKTHTRRVVQLPRAWRKQGFSHADVDGGFWNPWQGGDGNPKDDFHHWQCGDEWVSPNYQPGDRLWVRETWHPVRLGYDYCDIQYAVDDARVEQYPKTDRAREQASRAMDRDGWKPSIHMPRWASRILLEVTAVRVERVQEISEHDAKAEGVTLDETATAARPGTECRDGFMQLWDRINAKRGYSWDSNPWVWVVTFKKVELANE